MALIAQYKLDELTGTTAVDNIGAVNGTLAGGVTLNQPGGPADFDGKSMLFDGIDGTINLGNNFDLDLTDTASYSFWINSGVITGSSNVAILVKNELTGTAKGLGITIFNGLPSFFINTQGDTTKLVIRSAVALTLNTWQHVVITKGVTANASDSNIYIDGSLVAKTTVQDNATGTSSNALDFIIGALDGVIHYDGLLDDVRIYDSELTAQEVSDLFAEASTLIAHYRLDELTGTTVVDDIGAVNGTISGGVTLNQPGSPADAVGGSVSFDGVNGFIDLGNNFNFEFSDTFSFSFYYKTSVTGFAAIASSRNPVGIELALRADGKIQISLNGTSGSVAVDTSNTYPLNTWQYFVVTYSGSGTAAGFKIYNQGVLGSTVTIADDLASSIVGASSMLLGKRPGLETYGPFFLDDLRIFDSELTAQEVSDIFAQASTLIAHYRLDELTGTVATDDIGAVNGTIAGGVTLNQPPSPADAAGKSMLFGGVDGFIDLGNNFNFERTDPFTFSFWAEKTTVNFGAVFSSLTTAGIEIGFRGNGKIQAAFVSPVGEATVETTTDYPLSGWHMYTITYSGSSIAAGMSLYIDGSPDAAVAILDTLASGSTVTATSLQIGNRPGNGIFLDASLDDLRIYNSELTAQEVLDLFTGGGTLQLTGPIIETLAITVWDIHAFSLDGTIHLKGTSTGTTYSLPVTQDIPYVITGLPSIQHIWEPGKAIASGDYMTSPATHHIWIAGGAGTTGGSEPTWNLVGTTIDNDITWTYVEELVQPISQGPLKPAIS